MSKLLVLDDNFEMLMVLRTMVSAMGHTVRSCSAPREALGIMEREQFDLVLCDFLMPEMNGDVFMRSAREAGYEGHLILATAFPNLIDSANLKSLNVAAVLFKPFRAQELRDAIEEALSVPAGPVEEPLADPDRAGGFSVI